MMDDKRRIRECLLWGGVIATPLAAGLLVEYLKGAPVSPSYYRVLSLLHFVCFAALVSCLAALPLRAKQPPSSLVTTGRALMAVLFTLLGLKAGCQYVHL